MQKRAGCEKMRITALPVILQRSEHSKNDRRVSIQALK